MIVRVFLYLFAISVLWSCNERHKYPISDAAVDLGYYLEALRVVGDEIEKKPGDLALRKRRIALNQQLKWPLDANEDLDLVMARSTLDLEIYHYSLDFYLAYHEYEKMLSLVEAWERENGRAAQNLRWKVIALRGLNRLSEAKSYLWALLQEGKEDVEGLTFAANTYLELEDSTRALYALRNLAMVDVQHPQVLSQYVPILLINDQPTEALRVLSMQDMDDGDFQGQMLVATTYFLLGEQGKAHAHLQSFDNEQALFKRADWYSATGQIDSAVMCMDQIILADSSVKALMYKADLLEKRGWLSQSYEIYQGLFLEDTTYSIAGEKARNVARKIAYLRSLREREEKIPILDLSSKKETENE